MTQDRGTPATTPSDPEAEAIGWQEAVARLAAERTRVETCAAMLKKRGDPAAVDQGALAYGEAKTEVDGFIAGLLTALDRDKEPVALPELEERLNRAVTAREAFAALVRPLVPEWTSDRDLTVPLDVAAAISSLLTPITLLWHHAREADPLAARTIAAQLEAACWPDFAGSCLRPE